jgi:hypothetical protein
MLCVVVRPIASADLFPVCSMHRLVHTSQVGLNRECCIIWCARCVQVSALEDMWKAAPDAKVEDLEAAEVRG